MPEMNYRDRIIRDPRICGGEPVIKGTRVALRTVLASLAEGDPPEDIIEDFPTLTIQDVTAVARPFGRSVTAQVD